VGEGEDEEVDFPLEALGVWKQRSPRGLKVFESVLEMVEGLWPTPLVKLSASTPERRIFAKLECFNPFSNSIKDRVGWYLMKGLEGDLIYEATSANTGISLASMASILGKKVRVYVPESVGDECMTALRLLGAEVVKLPVKLTVEGLEKVKEDARRHHRRREAHQEVRVPYGRRSHQLSRRRGGDLRLPGAQRRREDHDDKDAYHPAEAE